MISTYLSLGSDIDCFTIFSFKVTCSVSIGGNILLTCFMGTIIVFVHDLYSVGRDTSTYKVKLSNLYLYVPVHVYHIPVYLA